MAFSWLHLSDVHCKEQNDYVARRVLQKAIDDVQRQQDLNNLQFDMLALTGDVAFGNLANRKTGTLKEQYDIASRFIDTVRQKVGVPLERVFIVPGNHDVDRYVVTEQDRRWLRSTATLSSIEDAVRKNSGEFTACMRRLGPYRQFITNLGLRHLLADKDRLVYGQVIDCPGGKLGVAGFNTAWTCHDDSQKEKGQLWLGASYQLGATEDLISSADLKVLLMHHPPGWFQEHEAEPLRVGIENRFNFLLHGHEHALMIEPAIPCKRVSAPSCYEKKNPDNGYNLAWADPKSKRFKMWFRRYDQLGEDFVVRGIAPYAPEGHYDSDTTLARGRSQVSLASSATEIKPPAGRGPGNGTGAEIRDLSGTWYTRYVIDGSREVCDEINLSSEKDGYRGASKNNPTHEYTVSCVATHPDWLTGVWRSVKPGSVYVGSMLLHVNLDGQEMRGKWLGSQNGKVVDVGEWVWARTPFPQTSATQVTANAQSCL